MVSRLMRAVAPAVKATSRGGTPVALAINRHSASLASPSLGGAATRALYGAPVRQMFDAFDFVAAALRGQPHSEGDAAGGR